MPRQSTTRGSNVSATREKHAFSWSTRDACGWYSVPTTLPCDVIPRPSNPDQTCCGRASASASRSISSWITSWGLSANGPSPPLAVATRRPENEERPAMSGAHGDWAPLLSSLRTACQPFGFALDDDIGASRRRTDCAEQVGTGHHWVRAGCRTVLRDRQAPPSHVGQHLCGPEELAFLDSRAVRRPRRAACVRRIDDVRARGHHARRSNLNGDESCCLKAFRGRNA